MLSVVPGATPASCRSARARSRSVSIDRTFRVEAAAQLGDRTDGPLGVSLVDALDDLVVGKCPAERLARFRRRQRPRDGHRQVTNGQIVPRSTTRSGFCFQIAHRGERQDGGDVRIAVLDQLPARLRLGDDAKDDPIEMVALPSSPVPGVPLQHDPCFDVELGDPIRARAQSLAAGLRPGVAPIAVDLMLLQRGHVDDRGSEIGRERRLEQGLRLGQVEDERAPIRGRYLGGVGNESPRTVEGARPNANRRSNDARAAKASSGVPS